MISNHFLIKFGISIGKKDAKSIGKGCGLSYRIPRKLSPEFNALLTHWVPKEEFEDCLDEIYI